MRTGFYSLVLNIVQNTVFFSCILIALKFDTCAQVVIFSENFGTANPGSISASSASFQNNVCPYSYGGTGTVTNITPTLAPTSDYIELNVGETFTISGVNTLGFSNVFLSYSLLKNAILLPNNNAGGIDIEVSINGGAFTPLSRNQNNFSDNVWVTETTGTISPAENTAIRFSNNSNLLSFNAVTVRIDNFSFVGTSSLVITNPATFSLGTSSYSFSAWSPSTSPGLYPANMIFHYGDLNSLEQTLSSSNGSQDYQLAYNLSCGTRIVGENSNGISFRNAISGNSTNSRGNLGEAVLALNTTCRGNIQISWVSGSISASTNTYNLRAQYRVGLTGSFTDLPGSTSAIEYSSGSPTSTFGPIVLPAICENTTNVQIRWVYYKAGGTGTPSEIFLDDIFVNSAAYPVISPITVPDKCGNATVTAMSFTTNPNSIVVWTNSNASIFTPTTGTGSLPAFVTPFISGTTDQTATINYTAYANSCASTSSFEIVVSAPKVKSTWQGQISDDWFNPDNWSKCVCDTNTEATIGSQGPYPAKLSSGIGQAKDIKVSSNATLTTLAGTALHIKRDFENNGNTSLTGSVTLDGSALQTISGTTPVTFSTLIVTNTIGVSVLDSVYINGALQLSGGTFSTGGLLTLKSTSLGTGRIGQLSGNADIAGNVTIERRAPGGATGWAQFGEPVSSALSFNDWNDDFVITCTNCPYGYYGFTSIYSYDETAIASSYSASGKYIPIGNISDNILIGKGYWIYFGNGSPNTTDIVFDVTGTVGKNSVPIAVSNSSVSDQVNYGWNLISNPLPSAISFSALLNGNANVDNAYYVYNADENNGLGGYSSFINSVNSSTLVTMSDNIPMCQGFYVHASANTTLYATEACKTSADPLFLRPSTNSAKPVFRLTQTSANNSDMCTFYFENGATKHFQTKFDAYKLNFDPSTFPYIGSVADNILTSINGLPPLTTNMTVDVKAITPVTGTFSFSGIKTDFPYDVCVTLFDRLTLTTTDMLNDTYTCTLFDTTDFARFQLSFFSKPLNGTGNSIPSTCLNPDAGYLTANAFNSGPWNYEWFNNGTLVKTTLNSPLADTLWQPGTGMYTVKINTAGQCDRFQKVFYVNKAVVPTALFDLASDTAYLSAGGIISFNNKSLDYSSSLWDFGDGQQMITNQNPSYAYSNPGFYDVRLTVESSSGCIDTAVRRVFILDDISGLHSNSRLPENIKLIFDQTTNSYFLKFSFTSPTDVELRLNDQAGNELTKENWSALKTEQRTIDLSQYSQGVYLLCLKLQNQQPFTFKLIR